MHLDDPLQFLIVFAFGIYFLWVLITAFCSVVTGEYHRELKEKENRIAEREESEAKRAFLTEKLIRAVGDRDEADKLCPECGSELLEVQKHRKPTGETVCFECEVVPGVCPFCDKRIATDLAQQCLHCGKSWFDHRVAIREQREREQREREKQKAHEELARYTEMKDSIDNQIPLPEVPTVKKFIDLEVPGKWRKVKGRWKRSMLKKRSQIWCNKTDDVYEQVGKKFLEYSGKVAEPSGKVWQLYRQVQAIQNQLKKNKQVLKKYITLFDKGYSDKPRRYSDKDEYIQRREAEVACAGSEIELCQMGERLLRLIAPVRPSFTMEERSDLLERYDGLCQLCGDKIESPKGEHMHIDHVVPHSKGGSNDLDNLQPTHPSCNMKKGNRD